MAEDLGTTIEAFWLERQRGVFFPPAFSGKLTLDQSYRVQLGLITRREAAGERHAGWKVGLTSKAIQDQFRVHEPVFGCLLEAGVKQSGHVFAHADLITPGFENEVCMRLGRRLSGRVTIEDARHAVEVCYPALEIIETRGDFTADLPLALADNAQQKAIVLGPATPLGNDLDLSTIAVRVDINGEEVASGTGDAVLGNPLNSLVWLVGKLQEFGRVVEAGDLVMTGSFTRQFPIAAGDHIRASFNRLGVVEARF